MKADYSTFSLALRAIEAGIWDYDVDTDTLDCDNRWYCIIGINEIESPIRSIEDFKRLIHPEDVARATAVDLDEITEIIRRDGRYYNEFRIIRPSGAIRLLRSVACILVDPVTSHRRAVGCITDLTDSSDLEHASARWPMSLAPDSYPARHQHGKSIQTIAQVQLSAKERECLRWVSYGKTASETANIMGKSRRTIEFHINNSVRKLCAVNKVHAVVIAIRADVL